jgi:hypothetical protein
MHTEQNDKARRMNSFVTSGLPTDDQKSDTDFVQQLCHEEFGQSVDVLSLKRLGQPQQFATQPHHPRRLLVHIKSRDQAQTIIQIARRLRKSSNSFVRAHIYINPNLNKAEAMAKFEIRQQRRDNNRDRQRLVHVPGDTWGRQATVVADQSEPAVAAASTADAGEERPTSLAEFSTILSTAALTAASDIQAVSEILRPTSEALKTATAEAGRLHYTGQL